MSNILVIKHGSLGDIAQASGVIQDIFENHREDKIYLLTTKTVLNPKCSNEVLGSVAILDETL